MGKIVDYERDTGGFHLWIGPFGIHAWWEKPRRVYLEWRTD